MMEKANCRRLMKEKLSLIDKASAAEMSSLLSKNLLHLFSYACVIPEKFYVGAFAPMAKEPHLDLLTSTEWEEWLAFPAYNLLQRVMIFKKARINELALNNDFGPEILGPKPYAQVVHPGLILIPGLAFSESGMRLGRGKGFYDQYLAHYSGIKVGVCFSDQIVDLVPAEKHDVNLDYIVTEKKWIKCKLA
jgi:5-formyltetrahydrofolate cyclo-ligase